MCAFSETRCPCSHTSCIDQKQVHSATSRRVARNRSHRGGKGSQRPAGIRFLLSPEHPKSKEVATSADSPWLTSAFKDLLQVGATENAVPNLVVQCTYVCMHACMHACMYVCGYVNVSLAVCMLSVCMYVCMCLRAYKHKHCTYICTFTSQIHGTTTGTPVQLH